MQARIEGLDGQLSEVPTAQWRKPAAPLERYVRQNTSRDDAIADAYASGGYSMQEIVHFSARTTLASAGSSSVKEPGQKARVDPLT